MHWEKGTNACMKDSITRNNKYVAYLGYPFYVPIKRDPHTGRFASGGQAAQVQTETSMTLDEKNSPSNQLIRCHQCNDVYVESGSDAELSDEYCGTQCEDASEFFR